MLIGTINFTMTTEPGLFTNAKPTKNNSMLTSCHKVAALRVLQSRLDDDHDIGRQVAGRAVSQETIVKVIDYDRRQLRQFHSPDCGTGEMVGDAIAANKVDIRANSLSFAMVN